VLLLTFSDRSSEIYRSLVNSPDYVFVLQAFCPLREIPKGRVHENVLEAFSIKDKVRGSDIDELLSDRMAGFVA